MISIRKILIAFVYLKQQVKKKERKAKAVTPRHPVSVLIWNNPFIRRLSVTAVYFQSVLNSVFKYWIKYYYYYYYYYYKYSCKEICSLSKCSTPPRHISVSSFLSSPSHYRLPVPSPPVAFYPATRRLIIYLFPCILYFCSVPCDVNCLVLLAGARYHKNLNINYKVTTINHQKRPTNLLFKTAVDRILIRMYLCK